MSKYLKSLVALLTLLFSSVSCTSVIVLTPDNTITFRGQVDSNTVSIAMQEMIHLCVEKKQKEIYLVLDSPGGSVFDGMNFIKLMKSMPCKVNSISLNAASMAFHMAQNTERRYVLPSSVLMSHRARIGGVGGQLDGEIQSRIKLYQDFVDILDKHAADRLNISLKEYKYRIVNEWWSVGVEAIKDNMADSMANIVCSKDLIEKKIKVVERGFFGSFEETYSACPLIPYPLETKVVE